MQPNQYEEGRANVIIYNWSRADSVLVDISSSGPAVGRDHEVRDAQNYFAAPVASGTHNGSSITVLMTSTVTPQLIGTSSSQPFHNDWIFGAFVLVPK